MRIKIVISGEQGTAKSSIAELIDGELSQHGVHAEFYLTNEDIDTSNMEQV